MSYSKLRTSSQRAREHKSTAESKYGLNSSSNFLFYGGTNGKSILSLTQTGENISEPILVVSAAGGSSYLQPQYPNAVIRSASTLKELEEIALDLEQNYKILSTIRIYLDNQDKLKKLRDEIFLPNYYPLETDREEGIVDFKYLITLAKEDKFIFSRVVLEECEVISSMIQDRVEKMFSTEILGEDKALRGKDWSALSSEIVSFYTRWLRLPCETILATSDRQPGEKEGLTQIIPVLCQGSAQRQLTSMIGNVLNVGNDSDGYYVMMKPSKKVLTRTKFFPLNMDFTKIPERLDVTNHPEKFWNFVSDALEGKYNLTTA